MSAIPRPRSSKQPSAAALDDRLHDGIERLGLGLPPADQARLLAFLELLTKWNGVYNLTSVRDPADMVPVHLLDALSIVPVVDASGAATVLDVGSGAGLPGIPLSIARATLTISSIDAVAKKIAFQQQAKAALRLDRFTAVHGRVEDLRVDPPDLIVSRAYADLATMLHSIEHLAGPETTVLAMKAVVSEAELSAVPRHWSIVESHDLDVPYLGADRRALLLARSDSARTGQS